MTVLSTLGSGLLRRPTQEIVDEDLANFRQIKEEQDREYAESLAIDEAKLYYNVCKLV